MSSGCNFLSASINSAIYIAAVNHTLDDIYWPVWSPDGALKVIFHTYWITRLQHLDDSCTTRTLSTFGYDDLWWRKDIYYTGQILGLCPANESANLEWTLLYTAIGLYHNDGCSCNDAPMRRHNSNQSCISNRWRHSLLVDEISRNRAVFRVSFTSWSTSSGNFA